MISFDFDYYRPNSISKAVEAFHELTKQGKKVIYYAGGTEIISQARLNQKSFDAVIDIKKIPECNVLEINSDHLLLGTALTLTKISNSNLFPLLNDISRRSADHTARDKITLGGNICGNTPYKETILPFLLSDSQVIIAGNEGMKLLPITEIFKQEWQLNPGEFIVQIVVDKNYTMLPYASLKKTKLEKVDYPLVTVAAIVKDQEIRVAFSGLCCYPFRLSIIEKDLNNTSVPLEVKIKNLRSHLPAPILDDLIASSEYRAFVTQNAMAEIFKKLGGIK